MAKQMGVRPSEIYPVQRYEDDPLPFWFDRAVMALGSMIEQDMEQAASGAKNSKSAQTAAHARLMKWLDFDDTLTKQRFAAPTVTKTVRG